MNLFDIFILVFLVVGLARGVFRGLVSELSSILGVFIGFYVAYAYYDIPSTKLLPWIHNRAYINILSFLLIFALIVSVVGITALLVKYLMNLTKMGWINRACGGFFGLLKSGLVVAILLVVITSFLPQNIMFVKNSCLSPYVLQVSEAAASVVSQDMKLNFFSRIKKIKSQREDGTRTKALTG